LAGRGRLGPCRELPRANLADFLCLHLSLSLSYPLSVTLFHSLASLFYLSLLLSSFLNPPKRPRTFIQAPKTKKRIYPAILPPPREGRGFLEGCAIVASKGGRKRGFRPKRRPFPLGYGISPNQKAGSPGKPILGSVIGAGCLARLAISGHRTKGERGGKWPTLALGLGTGAEFRLTGLKPGRSPDESQLKHG
jgi:hypothetical protein